MTTHLRLALAGLFLAGACSPETSVPDAGSLPRCGDGIVQLGEACDDGNASSIDGCRNDCSLPSCGNGVVDPGEQCDDGNASNIDACTNVCLNNVCGDGFIHDGVEVCDDGNASNTDGCRSDCSLPVCGDGFVQPGEQCDDGDTNALNGCTTECKLPACGDGFIQFGEECDDGNTVNTDGCTNLCMSARCGDGVVETGVESCDDGNSDNTDACLATCVPASCGDGYVQANVEECDDQNSSDSDACLNSCEFAHCGDGFLLSGTEVCDPSVPGSGPCDVDCTAVSCGDGQVNVAAGESCDDQNDINSDGCSHCVAQANTVPVANDGSLGVTAGVPGTITLTGSDPDGDAVSFKLGTAPQHGTLSGAAPNLTYTADASFSGQDSFTFKVNDGFVDSAEAIVLVTVTAPNYPPLASVNVGSADPATGLVLGTVIGVDANGDTLTYTVTGAPALGAAAVNPGTGAFIYTPSAGARHQAALGGVSTDTFTIRVDDNVGGSLEVAVTVTIAPANTQPIADDGSLQVSAGVPGTITLTGSDADGDVLTFKLGTMPLHGTVTGTAPNLTYTPAASFSGQDSFTFKVNDGVVDSAEGIVLVKVMGSNSPPTASVSVGSADPVSGSVMGTVTGVDADGDPLSYAVSVLPAFGVVSLTPATGAFIYTPSALARHEAALGGTTTDSFMVRVDDNVGGSVEVSVSVTISPGNNAPAVSGPVTGNATEGGAASTLDALSNATDADGDILSVANLPQPLPAGVTFDAVSRAFTLDPTNTAYASLAAGETTTVTVNYDVTDGLDATAASVVWTVSGVDSFPLADALGTYTDPNTGIVITRTLTNVVLGTLPANWISVSATYGGTTDTVPKVGGTTVGKVTKINNVTVTVALTSSEAFSLSLLLNGSGTVTFNFNAI